MEVLILIFKRQKKNSASKKVLNKMMGVLRISFLSNVDEPQFRLHLIRKDAREGVETMYQLLVSYMLFLLCLQFPIRV